jgi:hypothetical protein
MSDVTPATAPVATPAPESKKADTGLTEYLVLKQDGESWVEVNVGRGRTTEKAIEAVVEKLAEEDQGGRYVAVVKSRWVPIDITAKVERSLVLKAVKGE